MFSTIKVKMSQKSVLNGFAPGTSTKIGFKLSSKKLIMKRRTF
jgi:hypothetical protein